MSVFVAGLWLGPAMAAPTSNAPDSKKAADPKKPSAPDPKSIAAVNAAVAALVKEAQAGFKDPTIKLREKCDYFVEKPSAEVTPETILMGLERSQNGDPRVDAYVKWQLLSAMTAPFSEELGPRAAMAYRRAPEPFNHPGMDRRALTTALYRVGTSKKDRMEEVNKGFTETVAKTDANNLYILRYRKDLYSRLPVSGDSLMAGLEDTMTRVRHGVAAQDIWEPVSGSIQSWALSADGRQRDAMLQMMTGLLKTIKDNNFKPYVRVIWSDDPKTMGMRWEDRMSLEDAKVQAAIDSIRNSAKMLGDAGFKDKK
jgi:hypothetical protein